MTKLRLALLAMAALGLSDWNHAAFAQNNSPVKSTANRSGVAKQKAPYKVASRVIKHPVQGKSLDNPIQKNNDSQSKKAAAKNPSPIADSRKSELLAFVKQHHEALLPLLKTLERHKKQQYAITMRNLDREIRNLQNQQKRAPTRYPNLLAQWVVNSKIRLKTAQLAREKTEQQGPLLKDVENLLKQLHNLKQRQAESDITTLKKRLDRLEKEQKTRSANFGETLAQGMEKIKRDAKRLAQFDRKSKQGKKNSDNIKNKKIPVKQSTKAPNNNSNKNQP